MADLFMCTKMQGAELPKTTEKFKHRDKNNKEDELIFVGMENANNDNEILFVGVISKPKPVASNILNRGLHSKAKRKFLNQHTASHETAHPQSECLAVDSPVLSQPSSHSGYKGKSLQVMSGNTSDVLSQCSQRLPKTICHIEGQDESNEVIVLDVTCEKAKRPKLSDKILGERYSPSVVSPKINTSRPSEGIQKSMSHVQDGVAQDKAHFKCLDPERANQLEMKEEAEFSSSASENKAMVPKQGNLIMLLPDFYYGQHSGDRKHQRQKTHRTFKCPSCWLCLKNVKFMYHMSHHLELEKQRDDSWEIHTTCRHCHRHFPTPFELQNHIENVHIAQEPANLCQICELSFRTNQVLLEHMKDNHKPGEMPYLCQVCKYRSSAFVDLETHFTTCHRHTDHLLCFFCLKIFKTASYVKHCWEHWNKKTFQCSQCRLQFLTFKAKKEHQTRDHQTFKIPAQLEGLPPEMEDVIIKTSDELESGDAAYITVSIADPQFSSVNSKRRTRYSGRRLTF